ncbi:MAG: tRNA glutamyl-Q(34) synthetase GluQRS [Planctomycetota bacterium]
MEVTRLAPSPTGALHLGNARTFLINWALARQNGWRVLLRIEDLDGPRVKAGAAQQAVDTLRWLGIDWDEGPIHQSADLSPYVDALTQLAERGEAYPCRCTRSQIAAAALSAPHPGDMHDVRYPGTCRPAALQSKPFDLKDDAAWRLRTPDDDIAFNDAFYGRQTFNVQQSVGDFLVATKAGLPSYQLAVVVDDSRQAITQVVRGDDLLASTPRQVLLYERLGLGPLPTYWHVPMIIGEDGRRLAKRHGDTRIDTYRRHGTPAERVLGLLAEWCGVVGERTAMPAGEFLEGFRLDGVPRDTITFHSADDAWLQARG